MHRVGKIHTQKVSMPSGHSDDDRPIVLFVCVHNAGRSRMAQVFLERLAGDRYAARSAGTEPAARPHPEVIAAMQEEGLQLDSGPGTLITQEMLDSAIAVISMGCDIADACPANLVETEDWDLEDPKGKSSDEVARIRDQIEMKVRNLVARLDRETAAS
jgi:protein-tyrosine-phosphatase